MSALKLSFLDVMLQPARLIFLLDSATNLQIISTLLIKKLGHFLKLQMPLTNISYGKITIKCLRYFIPHVPVVLYYI